VKRALLVVVPAHDEAESLPQVLDALAEARDDCDVLVVDDGSTDGSAAIARAHGATVVSHEHNLGYGAALVTGYRWALARDYETIVQLDADGQHDPAQIERLLSPLASGGCDVVVGSRMIAANGYVAALPRRVGIHLFAWLGRRLTGRPITDPTSGFIAMNRRAAAFLAENTPHDFPDLNVLVALYRAGVRVLEVPVTMSPRRHGVSQMRGLAPFVYVPKMLWYIASVYRGR
jgi:glycosyltransferase involved in cell wall biosynthesis